MAFGTRIDLRKKNKRNHVIDLFRRNDRLSKIQARTISGYSMNTILTIFDGLIADNLIVESGGEQKPMGRKATFFTLNEKKCVYIGLTFNQSGIYSSLMSFSFRTLHTHFTPLALSASRNEFIEHLKLHVDSLFEKEPSLRSACIAAGIAVPGDIDSESGILRSYTLMPKLNGLNFRELLGSMFPKRKIYVDHNIRGMVSYFLLDRNLIEQNQTILYISARSATASGIIHRGTVVTAHGEFGHVHVADDARACICGRTGCLDGYFSFNSFMELLQSEAERLNVEKGAVSLEVLERAYAEGNVRIRAEMDARLARFTSALLDMINITVPNVVILSGELLKIYGDPIAAIRRVVQEHYRDSGYVPHYSRAKLVFKDLETDIAALGICHQMIEEDWGYAPPGEGD
jgi:predicted NBD/HSP70 family sugar kinase